MNFDDGSFLEYNPVTKKISFIKGATVLLSIDGSGNLVIAGKVTSNLQTSASFSPANPASTNSATAVMMGIGSTCKFTPKSTGIVEITITALGNIDTSTDALNCQLSYGTGSAPINGAAVTGTQVGTLIGFYGQGAALYTPICLNVILTGLTLNTQIWIDLAVNIALGGNASVSGIICNVKELPA